MISDHFLEQIAAAINGESYDTPAYMAFSSSVITPDATATSLPTEIGRDATTNSRVTNIVTFSATKSGATVGAGGDRINSLGLVDTSTGGTLFAQALVPSVLHTSTYDLEVNWKVKVERK